MAQYKFSLEKRLKMRVQRRAYYAKGRQYDINRKTRWTEEEIQMALEHKIPDKELSKKLGRSLQAIEHIRSKYKREITRERHGK